MSQLSAGNAKNNMLRNRECSTHSPQWPQIRHQNQEDRQTSSRTL